MKNIFMFMLTLLVLNLSACKSCNGDPGTGDAGTSVDATPVVDVVEDELPKFTTVEGDVWSIALPSPWYKYKDPIAAATDLLVVNDDKEVVLVMLILKYERTYDQFMIERVRELRGAGFAIANVFTVSFGCSKFVLVDAAKQGVQGYMWLTVDEEKKLAFDISCGGELTNRNDIYNECNEVVKSFRIKDKKECHLR